MKKRIVSEEFLNDIAALLHLFDSYVDVDIPPVIQEKLEDIKAYLRDKVDAMDRREAWLHRQ
jgi:hypothetical protein